MQIANIKKFSRKIENNVQMQWNRFGFGLRNKAK